MVSEETSKRERIAEVNIPPCNKGKRRIVDSAKEEQNYKFQAEPLV